MRTGILVSLFCILILESLVLPMVSPAGLGLSPSEDSETGGLGSLRETIGLEPGATAQPVPLTFSDMKSIEAILVYADEDVRYSLYGHENVEPDALNPAQNWGWWALGGGITAPVSSTPSPDLDAHPDVAFSREGYGVVVWDEFEEDAKQASCNPPDEDPNPVPQPRFKGNIRFGRLDVDPVGGTKWVLSDFVKKGEPDHILHDPSIAIDSNGRGIAIWVHTVVVRDANNCTNHLERSMEYSEWTGSGWAAPVTIPSSNSVKTFCGPSGVPIGLHVNHCPTDISFTSKLVGPATTRQQAIAVWMDYFETLTGTCGNPTALQDIFWPKYSVWNGGSFMSTATVKGGPFTESNKFSDILLSDNKLGISGDQRENAEVAFGIKRVTCSASAQEVYRSLWLGAIQDWLEATPLATVNAGVADIAFFRTHLVQPPNPDDTGIIVYDSGWATKQPDMGWMNRFPEFPQTGTPTIAALAHDRVESVWVASPLGGIVWAEMDSITETWSGASELSASGTHPEIGALTGSPSLPRAEWNIIEYNAGDGYATGANQQHNHIMQRYEGIGSTTLVNVAALYDNPGDASHTRYYYIKSGVNTGRTERRDILAANAGDPSTLTNFIVWAREHYPADRVILKLSDHGEGWRGTCHDGTGDRLQLPELRSALANAGGVFSILVFHPCLMGMVEVAYEIRNYAAFMTASQEDTDQHKSVDNPGTPHDETTIGFREDLLVQRLIDNPPIRTSNAVAGPDRGLVQLIVDDYAANNLGAMVPNRDSTYSALDLSAVGALASDIDAWAKAMVPFVNPTDPNFDAVVRAALRNLRNAVQQVSADPTFGDLFHFANLVRSDATLPMAITNAATSVFNRRNLVVAEWHDPGPAMGPGRVTKANTMGLNVWLPRTTTQYTGHSDAYSKLTFVLDFLGGALAPATTWSRLLDLLKGSTEVLVRLEANSLDLFIRVEDGTGRFVGGVSDKNCGRFCAKNEPAAVCNDQGVTKEILLPDNFSSFTWFVNGTLLMSSVAFTLTIQAIKDGLVIEEQIQSGTISPGQILSGTWPPPPPPPPPPPLPITCVGPIMTITIQTSPLIIFATEPVDLSASVSGGFPPYTLSWDLNGDGAIDSTAEHVVGYIYPVAGNFVVTLNAMDSTGQTSTCAGAVQVNPEPRLAAGKLSWTHQNSGDLDLIAKVRNDGAFPVSVYVRVDLVSRDPTRQSLFVYSNTMTLPPNSGVVEILFTASGAQLDPPKYDLTAKVFYISASDPQALPDGTNPIAGEPGSIGNILLDPPGTPAFTPAGYAVNDVSRKTGAFAQLD